MSAAVGITPLTPSSDRQIDQVLNQLGAVLLGKQDQTRLAVSCLLAEGHLLLEDVPGVGKTTLAHALSTTLGLPWKRIQFTNDILPADVIGFSLFNTQKQALEFKPGPVFTSVLLADEINRAPPKAQSALLEAMEERQVTVDGQSYELDKHFFVIATQNPVDQQGTFTLPESQLDRFLVSLSLGYPDPQTERQLLEQGGTRTMAADLEPILNPAQLAQWREKIDQVHISSPIFDYVQALLLATRETSAGLSPRAGLNLIKLLRAYAFINFREHVLPDDVRAVFPALAGHRLTGHVASGQVKAKEILAQTPMP